MRNLIMAIVAFVVPMTSAAQWRLDADIRIGRTNIDHTTPRSAHSGWGLSFDYYDKPSWGADVNIGRELSRGFALFTGLTYDRMRFVGVDRDSYNPYISPTGHRAIKSGMHVFSFITVPVRVEYRFFKDIIRPYAGLGASFMCATHKNRTENVATTETYKYEYETFVPTALFGLNLEYRRFIVGFARRQDLTHFWSAATTGDKWRMGQTTVKIGYRIF